MRLKNLVFLFCSVIHSSNSYPTNEPHIDLSIGAYNHMRMTHSYSSPHIYLNMCIYKNKNKKMGQENGGVNLRKKETKNICVNMNEPCNTTVDWASLWRRVSWYAFARPLHLGGCGVSGSSTVLAAFLWYLSHWCLKQHKRSDHCTLHTHIVREWRKIEFYIYLWMNIWPSHPSRMALMEIVEESEKVGLILYTLSLFPFFFLFFWTITIMLFSFFTLSLYFLFLRVGRCDGGSWELSKVFRP